MKKTLLFAALMCCIMSASAQPIRKESKQRSWEESLELVEKMNRHENIYTMKLDSVTMNVGDDMRILLDYDAHFNCTWIAIFYLYDEWEMDFAFEYAYDELDRLTTFIDYDDERKYEYVYNAQSLVEEIYCSSYQYDGTWEMYEKQVLTYDAESHLVLSLIYDMENGNWEELAKKTWDYEDGLLQAYTFYYYNEGEWMPAKKTEYTYNTEGLCIEETESLWTSQEFWRPDNKIVYQYNAQQLCIEKTEYIYWYTTDEWQGRYKDDYEYDASGNLLVDIYYAYQSDTQEWGNRRKTEYQYDADNNCTDYYEYFYYVYDDTWELEEVYHTAYGTPGIECIAGLSLIWDLFEFEFPIHNKVEQLVLDEDGDLFILDFHYSSTVGIAEQNDNSLTLWPNPASQTVHIEGLEAAEVQVYNALGQLIKTVRDTNEISVAGLAEGVYLVRITDVEGKKHVARVAVKE